MANKITSSERKGVLIIAAIALLVIALGLGFSLYKANNSYNEGIIITTSPPQEEIPETKKENRAKKSTKKSKSSSKKNVKKKTPQRQRNPIDEPI